MQKPKRVGLVDHVSMMTRANIEFVKRALFDARDKSFPKSRTAARVQRMRARIPAIEAANHRYFARVWCPHAETHPSVISRVGEVRSHLLIGAVVPSLVKEMNVLRAQQDHVGAGTGGRSFQYVFHTPSMLTSSVPEGGTSVVYERAKGRFLPLTVFSYPARLL